MENRTNLRGLLDLDAPTAETRTSVRPSVGEKHAVPREKVSVAKLSCQLLFPGHIVRDPAN